MTFLDQNILEKVSKYQDKFLKIEQFIRGNDIFVTPFSLIEFSGTNIKKDLFLTKKEFSIRDNMTFNELTSEARHFYEADLREDFLEIISEKLQEQKPYKINGNFFRIYEGYAKNLLENKKEIVRRGIILDRMSALDYDRLKKYSKIAIGWSLVRYALKHLNHNTDTENMFRLIDKAAECIPNESKSFRTKRDKASVKTNSDLGDVDLIHYACFGFKNKPVTFLTTDNRSIVINRILLYYKLLHYSYMDESENLKFCKDCEVIWINKDTFEIECRGKLSDILITFIQDWLWIQINEGEGNSAYWFKKLQKMKG